MHGAEIGTSLAVEDCAAFFSEELLGDYLRARECGVVWGVRSVRSGSSKPQLGASGSWECVQGEECEGQRCADEWLWIAPRNGASL